MKRVSAAAAILFLLVIAPAVRSQVSYYGVDNVVNDDGSMSVKMTVTFTEAVKDFNFIFFGRVKDFNATSNAGPVYCNLESSSATSISCAMPFNYEKRSLEMTFVTNDLVKSLKNKFLFSGDFTLNKNIDAMFVSLKLPEGMILTANDTYPTLPSEYQTISDGRRIIVTWSLANIMSIAPLKFQIAYEPTFIISNIPDYLVYFVVGVAITAAIAYLMLRRLRKPKEVILSVLDEYEKKVMDSIVKAGGTINQKKIVQETGLSKAKVSRVIKSLVERGLVESERLGRTSRIKLVKKRFGYF